MNFVLVIVATSLIEHEAAVQVGKRKDGTETMKRKKKRRREDEKRKEEAPSGDDDISVEHHQSEMVDPIEVQCYRYCCLLFHSAQSSSHCCSDCDCSHR